MYYVSLDTGCVGRVGMPQRIFNPPSQFSRLGIQRPALVSCSCVFVLVCLVRVRGDLFSFLKFFGWCAIHMYFHVHTVFMLLLFIYICTCVSL